MVEHGTLLLSAIALTAISGWPGLVLPPQSLWVGRIGSAMLVAGGLCGLISAGRALVVGVDLEILRSSTPIPGAEFALGVDAISAFFLLPILLVASLGSIYGLEYWEQTEHPQDGQRMRLFYGLLTGALAILVLARTSVAFLVGWEIMAVSAFFLVGTQDEQGEVREAAWLYLAASHVATLTLFAMFALLYGVTGSFELEPPAHQSLSPQLAAIIFLLALGGFGLKAGVMPLHFWLPSAHAMAPSHVSAVMSGVLIKVGIYGLVRITSLLPDPPLWNGVVLLVLGTLSAVLGVAFALGQHDLKRLLAYHSIENIGIIVIGLGLALVGRTLQQPLWVVLGLSGCLLHTWNHALFKSLLFLSAGSVIHAQHTREIDELGGLAKPMPWTAGFFLLGATAICGLPPLNGFVSEFLIYLGLFQTLGLGGEKGLPAVAFVVPLMTLMGALAVACFVKVFGIVFLGVSRSPEPRPAHESGRRMRGPMGVLAGCCVVIGMAPVLVAPVLDRGILAWTGQEFPLHPSVSGAAPLGQIGTAAIALAGTLIAGIALLQRRIRSQPLDWTETWGCGYTGATPRMQYTASSLAQFLVSLLSWSLRPSVHRPHLDRFFPQEAKFESHVPEVVLDGLILPVMRVLSRAMLWVRLLQQGNLQIYLIYIFAMVVILLLFWR